MSIPLSPQDIEKLVQKAQDGHQRSFEKLFEHFFERIYRYVSFRVHEREVEDLVSDVFLKVVQHLERYSPGEKAGFNAWIFRIAHNTVIDFYRVQKNTSPLESEDGEEMFFIPDPNETPDEKTNQILEAQKLREALKEINPSYREILELKYLEGFSNREIAEITGKTEGNIRIIQLRGLKTLKEVWERQYE